MKRKLWFVVLLTIMFVFPAFSFAVNLTTKNISHSSDFNQEQLNTNSLITSSVAETSEEVTYKVNSLESYGTALEKVEENISETPIKIEFENFDIGEDFFLKYESKSIVLSSGNAIFTGKVTSTFDNPIFVINPSTTNKFEFRGITLKSNVENAVEPAIKLEKSGTEISIALGGKIEIDNFNYLFNYTDNADISISAENPLTSDSILYFSYPYEYGRKGVISNFSISYNQYLKPKSLNEDLYSVETSINSNLLVVSANVTINFGLDTEENDYSTYRLSFTDYFNFPALDKNLPANHVFAGWYAKITLSGRDYYVDCTEKSILALEENSLTELLTALPESANINSSFNNDNASQENLRRVVAAFLENNQSPTFVAHLVVPEFVIELDTAGGNLSEGESDVIYGNSGDDIVLPTPTKSGYDFAGWYTEDDRLFEEETFSDNYKLHAVWTKKTYTIRFITGSDNIGTTEKQFEFESNIIFPTGMTKTGHTFSGEWFIDNEFETKFTSLTMPALSGDETTLTLYAKWNKVSYLIYFIYDSHIFSQQVFSYGTELTKTDLPSPPDREGYTFVNWYLDNEFKNEFTILEVVGEASVYAKYEINVHTVTFYLGYGEPITKQFKFHETLVKPNVEKRANCRFTGWYSDSNYKTEFKEYMMPDRDLEVYAGWADKIKITIDTTVQKYLVNNNNLSFKNFSNIGDFVVEYYIDGSWQRTSPNAVGTYDVRISRAEDDVYAAFEIVIKNALEIKYEKINISWLIIIFIVIFAVEIAVSILLNVMRRMKSTLNFSISLLPLMSVFLDTATGDFVIDSTRAVPKTQFIMAILSGVLAIIGFIIMIYFIVKLHRTVPAYRYQSARSAINGNLETEKSIEDIQKLQNDKQAEEDQNIRNKVDEYLRNFKTDKNGYTTNREVFYSEPVVTEQTVRDLENEVQFTKKDHEEDDDFYEEMAEIYNSQGINIDDDIEDENELIESEEDIDE